MFTFLYKLINIQTSAIFQTQKKKETKKLSMIHVFDDVHKFRYFCQGEQF